MITARRPSSKFRRTRLRPGVETCESRCLMAANVTATLDPTGVLRVEGTPAADWIIFSRPSPDTLGVAGVKIQYQGSSSDAVPTGAVRRIDVRALGGDDRVQPDALAGRLTIPMSIDGGDGNDTLVGDAGPCTLFGGFGDDTLSGVTGKDFLDGYAGDDRLNIDFNFDSFLKNPKQGIVSATTYAEGNLGTDTFHVRMEVGALGSAVLQPFVAQAQRVTRALQPIVNVLNQPMPFGIKATIGQVIQAFGGGNAADFARTVDTINHLDLSQLSGSIDLGTYRVSSLSQVQQYQVGSQVDTLHLGSELATLKTTIGLDVGVLEDPGYAVRILLGQNVDLVSVSPKVDVSASISKDVPLYGLPYVGSLNLTLKGQIGVSAGARIAYDTAGFYSGHLLDGFYVNQASARFYASISGMVGVNILNSIGVEAGGSITGSVTLAMSDANGDGKIRINEFVAGQLAFTVSGKVEFALTADAWTRLPWQLTKNYFWKYTFWAGQIKLF